MISVTLDSALALFFSFSILIVFCLWLLYNKDNSKTFEPEIESLELCPFCGYTFHWIQTETEIITCPQCKSLLTHKLKEKQNETSSPKK